jgi:nucleotide-binding universal stress UspA family protein
LSDETKRSFSKILAAVDGSEQSFKAAEYAIGIGKKYSAQLIALTVLDISKPRHLSSTFITAPTYGLRELEEERKEAQQWLDKIANMVSEKGKNINFKSQIEKSMSVEGAIVSYAEEENIDLIVIGTRGRSGFTKLLLGSVASKVVTYAHCPVLVAK